MVICVAALIVHLLVLRERLYGRAMAMRYDTLTTEIAKAYVRNEIARTLIIAICLLIGIGVEVRKPQAIYLLLLVPAVSLGASFFDLRSIRKQDKLAEVMLRTQSKNDQAVRLVKELEAKEDA